MSQQTPMTPEDKEPTGLKDEDSKSHTLGALPYDDDDAPKTSYVPEGFEDVKSYFDDLRMTYEEDLNADYENRIEAIEDKKFALGEQWDPQVLEHRAGLPCLVINTIPQFTAQLVGDWRQARNSIKVLPSENGDVEIAQVRADLIRAIEYQSRADRVYDSAFESEVMCGDGAFRVSVEYAKDDVFDQDIMIRPIEDAHAVVWDRMAVDPTGKDARHCFVEDRIPTREFEEKWPGKTPSTLGMNQQAILRRTGWYDDKTVKVMEHWRLVERDRLLGLFQDGSIHVIDGDALDQVISKHGHPVKTRISPCLYAQMHLVTGWDILAGPYEYKLNRLPIIRMTGRVGNIQGYRIRYGLVRFMKDPARLRNFWRSIAAEQLGYAPKAQWIGPESAFEGNEDQFRKAHLTRDPILKYNDGAESPPQRVEPPAPQMALLNEAQVNVQDMKDVTGIHDASLGIKSNEVSGKAINARQREGDIAALTYYDNGNAAVLEAGDVINQLIPQIYDSTRIIRIIGQDETPKLIKINDPNDPSSPDLSLGNYDVALDTGPSYTTRRQEAAESMMNAIQVWPQLIQVAGDIIAKAQDWPGADKLADRLKKTIPPQFLDPEDQKGQQAGPQIDPQQIQQVMQEFQKLQQENQQLKADRSIDWYNAETARIKALSDNQVDANQIELQAIDKILNHSNATADRQHEADLAKQQLAQQQAQAQVQSQAQTPSNGEPQ